MRKPDPRFMGSRISLAQDQKGSLEGARFAPVEKGLASHSFSLTLAEEFKLVVSGAKSVESFEKKGVEFLRRAKKCKSKRVRKCVKRKNLCRVAGDEWRVTREVHRIGNVGYTPRSLRKSGK